MGAIIYLSHGKIRWEDSLGNVAVLLEDPSPRGFSNLSQPVLFLHPWSMERDITFHKGQYNSFFVCLFVFYTILNLYPKQKFGCCHVLKENEVRNYLQELLKLRPFQGHPWSWIICLKPSVMLAPCRAPHSALPVHSEGGLHADAIVHGDEDTMWVSWEAGQVAKEGPKDKDLQ